jgi:hypothetical protein
MSKLILRDEQQLPEELKILLGKNFIPLLRPEICYLPSHFQIQSLAGVAFKMTRFMAILFGAIFIYTLISQLTGNQEKACYQDEGVVLTFIMFAFTAMLAVISYRYFKKSQAKQKQIDSNELRLGLWITPTHLMTKDLNSGMECVAIKDILNLSTTEINNAHVSLVLVHLTNKQTFRIAANWLDGFANRKEDLKKIIEEKITKKDNRMDEINAYFTTQHVSENSDRFAKLIHFLSSYFSKNAFTLNDKKEIIEQTRAKIKNWNMDECLADELWWVNFYIDDAYHYGVNSSEIKEFKGYQEQSSLFMPLAKTALLESWQAGLISPEYVDEFIASDAFQYLEKLILKVCPSDYCVEQMMSSGKFSHLKVLEMSPYYNDSTLKERCMQWKKDNNIKDQ